MAEIANSPAATKVDEGAKKELHSRPVKPDEAAYKAKLAQAEKDHKLCQEKAVSKTYTPALYLLFLELGILH